MHEEASMDQLFLDKVHEAIENNLENVHFGVDEMALEIGISRSQLHRKLNILTGQSANKTIREFRLNKAMEMLKENMATAAEISYKVGFSSPSYFNTCFHDYFGYPPGKINRIKPTKNIAKYSISRNYIYTSMATFVVVVLAFVFYVIMSKRDSETNEVMPRENAIAIIPFKNLSEDTENVYFVEGLMDDLLNHLSSNQSLTVISRQSSEQYRGSHKSTYQIAEELGAVYILEGSVQHNGDLTRIIIQLIDAKNDKHVWSGKYDRQLNDVFAVQCEISKKIADELNAVLAPDKKE